MYKQILICDRSVTNYFMLFGLLLCEKISRQEDSQKVRTKSEASPKAAEHISSPTCF